MATAKKTATATAPAAADAAPTSDVVNDITSLEAARALHVITGDAATSKPQVAEGAIERFMAGEDDRRVMAIVAFNGTLAAVEIAPDTASAEA